MMMVMEMNETMTVTLGMACSPQKYKILRTMSCDNVLPWVQFFLTQRKWSKLQWTKHHQVCALPCIAYLEAYIIIFICTCSENVQWSSSLESINISPSTGTAGPKVPIPPSLIGIFSLFFTPALLVYIVEQSNQFALECMGAEKFASWTKITVEELQA